jgi:hypothetical protein
MSTPGAFGGTRTLSEKVASEAVRLGVIPAWYLKPGVKAPINRHQRRAIESITRKLSKTHDFKRGIQ